MSRIVSAFNWPTNGDMILALHNLGWLTDDMRILDCTYGLGVWWNRWQPDTLIGMDLDRSKALHVQADFTKRLPFPEGTFDAVAFDPPYAATGGKDTSSVKSTLNRYGRDTAAGTAYGVQDTMHRGFVECLRACKPGGLIVARSGDYVWSGSIWEGTRLFVNFATSTGCEVVEQLYMIGSPGPQPNRSSCVYCEHKVQQKRNKVWVRMQRNGNNNYYCDSNPATLVPLHTPDPDAATQVHAHNNLTTMTVFRTPTWLV